MEETRLPNPLKTDRTTISAATPIVTPVIEMAEIIETKLKTSSCRLPLYLKILFEEAKRRPKFIRKAIRQGENQFNTAAELETFLMRRKTAARQSDGLP